MTSALHFRKTGNGPNLVMLHGLFGSNENLGALARLLSDTFTVYSLDIPAHGKSQTLEALNLATMASACGDWLQEQGIQETYLLGHSLGGKIAMEMALDPNIAKAIDITKTVVIDIAPVEYAPRHESIFDGLLSLNTTKIRSRREADQHLQPFAPQEAIRSFLLKNLQKTPTGTLEWRMDLVALHRNYRQLIGANREGCYSQDTLFIKGGLSDYITTEHETAIRARFPNAKARIIADTGHWLHAEKPEHTADIIRRFLRPKCAI